MRSLVLLILCVFVGCSHSPNASQSASTPSPDPSQYDQIVIAGTNDFHGYLRPVEADLQGNKVILGGAEWFAGYVRILEKKFGKNLLLLDGGDIFQGTLESNEFLGEPVIRYYNLLPYRAAAVGNHEFDYGPRKRGHKDKLGALKDRMAEAKFPFVQSNIFHKKTGKLWREKNLYPSVIADVGGYKVGIIGLTTTTTPAKTLPQHVEELEFRDFVQPTLEQAQALRKQGAEFVVVTTHEGGEKAGDPIYELLKSIPKGTVDAIVSGHSHTEVHEFVHGVPVIQSKARGLYFGRIDLFVNKKTRKIEPSLTKIHEMQWICGTWFKNSESCDQKVAKDAIAAGKAKPEDFLPLRKPVYEGEEVKPDLAVRKVLAPYFAKTEKKKKEVLATALSDGEYFPSGENHMGFLFTRAFRWKFPEVKAVFINGGGIRRRFFTGPFTYGDLYEVHPFDNYSVAVKMTGKQFRNLIELGVSGAQSLPILWGAKVTYSDSDKPEFNRDLNQDGKMEKWERNRVLELTWDNGKPIRGEEEFWVATSDYLVSGGDNTSHIFDPIPSSKRKYLSTSQRDLLAEYLRAHPGTKIPLQDQLRINKVN